MKTKVRAVIKNKLAEGKKLLAILVDPDKVDEAYLKKLCSNAVELPADLFLVGGSLLTSGDLEFTISFLKKNSSIPTIIFPGSSNQISSNADAILFLSLLSSRNPEMLIGQQVIAAPYIKKANIEVISTAYLLIESGKPTTASYMSNSNPIPANKPEIAASTALAGEYLGMDVIYLDGGSGAENPISKEMIEMVKAYTNRPLFIGGGINSIDKLRQAFEAGADVCVIGNAFENNPNFAKQLKPLMNSINAQ